MGTVWDFENLEIWQISRKFVNDIYNIIDNGFFKKDIALIVQLKRAAISIMSNIAEGFMRYGNKEFIQFLFIARGSIGEVKSHLYIAMDRNYINREQFNICERSIKELLNKVDAFIKYLKSADYKGIKYKKQLEHIKKT